MIGTRRNTRQDDRHDQVATLVRSVPARLVEVSRGGCRLECSRRLRSGVSGLLAVELAGLMRIDDIRVARCQARAGAGAEYQIGAELLTTRRLGGRTVRMAVRKIIGGDKGVGHARQEEASPVPAKVQMSAPKATSDWRAPPPTSDRGS